MAKRRGPQPKSDILPSGSRRITKTVARKKAMLLALEDTLGVVTKAAKIAGVSRDVHYTWYDEDVEYKRAVDLLQDVALDLAEEKLQENMKKNDTTALIFYLKTKGKKRGYIEKQEVENSGGMRIEIIKSIGAGVPDAASVHNKPE